MGIYDNYDKDQANKGALIFLAFMLILCLIVGAAIAWKWVFAPIWGPLCLGLLLTLMGVKPPGQ